MVKVHASDIIFTCEREAIVKTQATVQFLRNFPKELLNLLFCDTWLADMYIVSLVAAQFGCYQLSFSVKTKRHRDGYTEEAAARQSAVSLHRQRLLQ